VFTRFITPNRADDMPGMWQRYYTRLQLTTRERLDPSLLDLLPPLARLSPPATVIDKTRYSGFAEPQLLAHLRAREADGLIITGPKQTSAFWLQSLAPWTLATASSLYGMLCAVRLTRVTMPSCFFSNNAILSRSKWQMRGLYWRDGTGSLPFNAPSSLAFRLRS
jgi:hypothetical protein